jgi:transposase
MQLQTTLSARVPRCSCDRCRVKTISVPSAEKHTRFTLLFQTFAMIDEKSFGTGQDYVSVMTDIDQSRVLEVTPDRATEAADQPWKTLSDEQRSWVKAVCMDIRQAYEASTEHRELQQGGDDRLKGVRQIPLFNPENLSEQKNEELAALRKCTLATGRAWSLKEIFGCFWHETDAVGGRAFFESWYSWAIRSRLDPIRKVARMLKSPVDRILTWFASPISNGVVEGFNSRIQSIKSAARGFRIFEHYRNRILFYCGKLTLKPSET